MTNAEIANLAIGATGAIANLLVVLVAICLPRIQGYFFGVHFRIHPSRCANGFLAQMKLNGKPTFKRIYYHIRLENLSKTTAARNVQVELEQVWRKSSVGEFEDVPLPVPSAFVWPPSEMKLESVTIKHSRQLDFGYISENDASFCPALQNYNHNYNYSVRAGETVRYGLRIVCDEYVSDRLFVIEVEYKGGWTEDLQVMANQMKITHLGTV